MQDLPLVIPPEVLNLQVLIRGLSQQYGLDSNLVMAFVWQESGGFTDRPRFEAKSSIVYQPTVYKNKLGISFDTEVNFQHCSWGGLQVMGFLIRQLGYEDHLHKVGDNAQLGLMYGCQALAMYKKKYVYPEDLMAAYNAGAPVIVAGVYKNQDYVNGVKTKWAFVEKLRLF